MRIIFCLLTVLLMSAGLRPGTVQGQTPSVSRQMAATAMDLWNDSVTAASGKTAKLTYDQGVVLEGIEGLWYRTGDGRYFRYMQQCMDALIADDGTIRTYKAEDYNIDNVLCGRIMLLLYQVTGTEKYLTAATHLREQLKTQPRTSEGGFWHKKRYPNQMWLDGLYMGEPFYAEWAAAFGQTADFDDIARQFILMEQHARDDKTGLLYHGWDESKEQKWADKTTGRSPNFWARAMGWYGLALVDVLASFPKDHPKRDSLLRILQRYASAVIRVQDASTGLWWDVLNFPGRTGNYPESSASSMFVYTLAKGARLGFLPPVYINAATKGYNGILKNFVMQDAAGQTHLKGTVSVSGLGGDPYRDGSYEYYIGEKVITDDPKGVGAFIQAANEMEMAADIDKGRGKTVLLDAYFNNEFRKDAGGAMVPFHYRWEDKANSGFSFLGHVFNKYGAVTRTNTDRPSEEILRHTNVYIIVDPDIEKETPNPHFIEPQDVETLYNWVKNGGVLLLMGNDTGNMEFDHFNTLAARFGMRFNKDSRNRVIGKQFEMGAFQINTPNPVLKTAKKIYIKELSTLNIKPPATPVLKDKGDVILASAQVGKGAVFAVGDPWIYNEYVDGRKLPADFQNYKAAEDLVQWLLSQVKK